MHKFSFMQIEKILHSLKTDANNYALGVALLGWENSFAKSNTQCASNININN